MTKFMSKKEVLKMEPSKSKTHYTGEIYPEIFSHTDDSVLNENMPLDAAIIWLGSFRIENGVFPKEKCPGCGKEEVLLPYMCGGSILSGCHTIQFYCTNCRKQFVTNDHIEYFRRIYRYALEHRKELNSSPKFSGCTKAPEGAIYVSNSKN